MFDLHNMATIRLNSTSSAQDSIKFHHKSVGSSVAAVNRCKGILVEFQLVWGLLYNLLQATVCEDSQSCKPGLQATAATKLLN